jgi:hypothetical protein
MIYTLTDDSWAQEAQISLNPNDEIAGRYEWFLALAGDDYRHIGFPDEPEGETLPLKTVADMLTNEYLAAWCEIDSEDLLNVARGLIHPFNAGDTTSLELIAEAKRMLAEKEPGS